MDAKRKALEAIIKKPEPATQELPKAAPEEKTTKPQPIQ
jgi:hypothetical protein